MSPQPPVGSPVWGGRDPAEGPLLYTLCNTNVNGLNSTFSGGFSQGGPPAVVVDPAVLAQQAISQMQLGPPVIRMSAPPDRGFVGVPLWLWVERGETTTGPVTRTVTAGAVSVTATARVAQVRWSMGPPGQVVTCRGPGTPWTGQSGPSPDCGYVYQLRSLPERTAGVGRWTIMATNVWSVSWSGAGASGGQTLELSSTASLAVGELQVVVDGPGEENR